MSGLPALRLDELDAETIQLLPQRETLSCSVGCVNFTNIVGVNLAIAVNAATIQSSANAIAAQYLESFQVQ
jgi:hypothetical protein